MATMILVSVAVLIFYLFIPKIITSNHSGLMGTNFYNGDDGMITCPETLAAR